MCNHKCIKTEKVTYPLQPSCPHFWYDSTIPYEGNSPIMACMCKGDNAEEWIKLSVEKVNFICKVGCASHPDAFSKQLSQGQAAIGQAAIEALELLEKWANINTGKCNFKPLKRECGNCPFWLDWENGIHCLLAELRTPDGRERIRKELEEG